LSCVTCSGTAAKVPGGSVSSNSLVATERLRNGRAFQSVNARGDIRLEPAMCVGLQIGSLLAVPIERNHEVAGLVELRWKDADAFEDWDERICELAVGLIGELLDREFGPVSAAAVVDQAEVATQSQNPHPIFPQNGEMGHTTLKPIMLKLDDPDEQSSAAVSSPAPVSGVSAVAGNKCRVCGHALNGKDDFCGNCGMLKNSTDDGLQSKWASMWFMQRAQKALGSDQDRRQRMWPLEKINAAIPAVSAEPANVSDEGYTDADATPDEADEAVAGERRGPRSVLSVLKLHLKGSFARKLSALIVLALLKKFS
jgi:hypothetical protein